jgi:hypothetical protein
VTEDISLNGRLFVSGNASLNGHLYTSGYVGIGTTDPTSSLEIQTSSTSTNLYNSGILKVQNKSIEANRSSNILVTVGIGSTTALSTNTAYYSTDIWGKHGFSHGMAGNSHRYIFKNNYNFTGTEVLTLLNDGKVGIGTTNPGYPLTVFGAAAGTDYANSSWFQGQAALTVNQTTNMTVGLYVARCILTSDYVGATKGTILASDKRIKENIIDIDNNEAIKLFRKLKPKTFNYIDKVNSGNQTNYGYIADDIVEDINKDFIKYIKNYIPNIYEIADVSGNIIVLSKKSTSNFEYDASGMLFPQLKCYDSSNNEIITNIVSIIDDKSFVIDTELNMDKVFVYGQEIDNYKHLSYESINIITASAVQAIDNTVQEQQQTIETLQNKLKTLEARLDAAGL